MNALSLWSFYSFRSEILYVCITFALILSLPILGVITLTQTGIDIVSDTLADINPITNLVELKNPLDGTIYTTLEGPFVWPTKGVITLEFAGSSIYQPFHTGLDIAGSYGEPVTPFMVGTVTHVRSLNWGYGNHVIIDHGDNVTSIYGHLSSINVSEGQTVHPGDIIGTQGSTGWSTGTHLHFETRVFGIPVNPRVFLGDSL